MEEIDFKMDCKPIVLFDTEAAVKPEEKCPIDETPLHETTLADDSTSAAPAIATEAKKRPATDKVYGYMKKKVLNHMEEHGCSAKSVETVINASKFDKEAIIDYMNRRMQLAQQHIHEECNSLSFINIEKWLEYFRGQNLSESCIYEPAMVINAIVDNEDMPDADALGGVDLKSVYKFVGNGLLGLPQPQLNEKSAKFLAKEFEIVVAEANTDFGDKETLRLNQKLSNLKELPCLKKNEAASIDPLGLSDNYQ